MKGSLSLVAVLLLCSTCLAQTADGFTPRIDQRARRRVSTRPQRPACHVPPEGPRGDSGCRSTSASPSTWCATRTARGASPCPPQVPGFHYYSLVVDGVSVNDPGSETFYGASRQMSGIEIPEAGVDFYELKDVPHGEVRSLRYFSKYTGAWRRASCTRRRATTRTHPAATPCCTCSTAAARTNGGGRPRGAWTPSWTT